MIGKSANVVQSNKVRGTLWFVAALPMLLGPSVFGGNHAFAGVGVVFLILGLVAFRKG